MQMLPFGFAEHAVLALLFQIGTDPDNTVGSPESSTFHLQDQLICRNAIKMLLRVFFWTILESRSLSVTIFRCR